jgi:hypothetical protein
MLNNGNDFPVQARGVLLFFGLLICVSKRQAPDPPIKMWPAALPAGSELHRDPAAAIWLKSTSGAEIGWTGIADVLVYANYN